MFSKAKTHPVYFGSERFIVKVALYGIVYTVVRHAGIA
jgi:hypothetical protein